jgi:hypothetical protein
MSRSKKINRLKPILIIASINFSFLFIIVIMLLKDIPSLSLLIKNYIKSGKSFFIPSLPTDNLIEGLSKKFPQATLNLTIGHLIDFIIMVNLTCYIESSIYHYIKKVKCGYCEFFRFVYRGFIPLSDKNEDDPSQENYQNYDFPKNEGKSSINTMISQFYMTTRSLSGKQKRKIRKNERQNIIFFISYNFYEKSLFLTYSNFPKSLWNNDNKYSTKLKANKYYSFFNLAILQVNLKKMKNLNNILFEKLFVLYWLSRKKGELYNDIIRIVV